MDKYYLIIFKNTHDAIEAEKIMKSEEIKITIMPTPTYITQSCGICIRFVEEEYEKIRPLAKEGNIHYKNIYLKDGNSVKEIIL